MRLTVYVPEITLSRSNIYTLIILINVNTYYKIYLILIFIALLLACFSYSHGIKKSVYLIIILSTTLSMEIYITYKLSENKNFIFGYLYHVFNPVEYSIFCMYYLKACTIQKFKSLIRYSIPVYITLSLCISFFLYHIQSMPGKDSLPAINIDIEGFLLFIIYTHLLFSLDIDLKMRIYNHSDFWISIGVLVFYGGAFAFLGLYSYLFKMNINKTLGLFGLIAQPLNIILYSCIITGLICSIRNKKYFISQY